MTIRHGSGALVATAFAACLALPAMADEAATIRAALEKIAPEFKPTAIAPTPIDNLYQVEVGPEIMFVTGDGRFLINGAVVNLETREDLAETARSSARQRAIAALDEASMIEFEAPEQKHRITVFTDIDCGYCRKLHQQIKGYNEAGISVRYLFYPRSGADSPSYAKAVSVWCADDRQAAMTQAKNGDKVPTKTCDNPVREHMALGERMGIRGTPAIVLENGELVPGYVEPKRLAAMLDEAGASQNAN